MSVIYDNSALKKNEIAQHETNTTGTISSIRNINKPAC